MGNRAFQVTRIIDNLGGQMDPLSGPVSTIVFSVDAATARIDGAAMLGVSPSSVTVDEYETTGLSMTEAIRQAEELDRAAESGSQMAGWLRAG